jgi:hypothetical protein
VSDRDLRLSHPNEIDEINNRSTWVKFRTILQNQNDCYNTTQPLSQNNSQNCERNPQPKNQIRLWRHHHKLHYSHLSFWRYLYYTIPSQHLVSANSPKIEWYGLCIWGYLCSTSERSDNKRVIRCTTERALNLFTVNIRRLRFSQIHQTVMPNKMSLGWLFWLLSGLIFLWNQVMKSSCVSLWLKLAFSWLYYFINYINYTNDFKKIKNNIIRKNVWFI